MFNPKTLSEMKKVFIVAAVCAAFGFNTAQAQTDTTAVVNNQMAACISEEPFKAIEADSLPQAIKETLATTYKDLTVKAAYVKEEEGVKTFKVTLADADDKTIDVIFNEKGEALPAENQN